MKQSESLDDDLIQLAVDNGLAATTLIIFYEKKFNEIFWAEPFNKTYGYYHKKAYEAAQTYARENKRTQ